jgi:hypothetical protein
MHMRCAGPTSIPNLIQAISQALGTLFLFRSFPAIADCDNTAPSTGQTVTCGSTAPNPWTTSVIALAGSTTNVNSAHRSIVEGVVGVRWSW